MIELHDFRWFRIDPVDAWFFRDGRPSNRGEDQSDLESDFPPNPPTVVGGLRAALARANGWTGHGSWGDDLKSVLGDGFDDLGNLSFLGPFVYRESDNGRSEWLWPLPQHVVGRMKEGHFVPEALLQPSSELVCCDVSDAGVRLPMIAVQRTPASDDDCSTKPPDHPDGVFVTTAGLTRILAGELPAASQCLLAKDLFVHESRVGILREVDTRTTGRNALYSPRYVRLRKGVSIIEGIAGIPADWTIPSLMPLGGESRMAAIELVEQAPNLPQPNLSENNNGNIAIGLSPVCFGDPWWGPGPGDSAARLTADLSGTVESVALDRPQRIGGWDWNARGPRPLLPVVPAGTVWWLSSMQSGKPHIILLGNSTRYGYGLTIVSSFKQTSGN